MKRPPQSAPVKKGAWTCPDDGFRKEFPALSQGLCDVWWEDGKPREPWKMSVNMAGTMVRITVTDEAERQSAFTDAVTLWEAFRLVDAAIAEETLQWRKWKGQMGRK